jgi:hypothetical protein
MGCFRSSSLSPRSEFGAWQKQKKAPGEKHCALEDQELGGVIDYDQSRSQNGNPG